MNMKLCSRCNKRPAVLFISKIEGDKTTQEGLCIKCAMDMNIGPIKDMMSKMGITDEDLDALNEQFSDMEADGVFENGGASTFPFLQGLFGGAPSASSKDNDVDLPAELVEDEKTEKGKGGKKLTANNTPKFYRSGKQNLLYLLLFIFTYKSHCDYRSNQQSNTGGADENK